MRVVPAQRSVWRSGGGVPVARGSGYAMRTTVLLVDDDPSAVDVVRDVFERDGATTDLEVVTGGDEALAYLEACVDGDGPTQPDLVLLDVSVPDEDCHEVLETIKTDPVLGRVPVVVLSPSVSNEGCLPYYRRYANTVLRKPDDPEEYADVIRSVEQFWLSTARLPRSNP